MTARPLFRMETYMQTDQSLRPAGPTLAYFAECLTADGAPDTCRFQLRNENREQLLRFFVTHVHETHHNPMTAEQLSPYVREVRV